MFTRCTPEEEEEANRYLALTPTFASSCCLPGDNYPAQHLLSDKFEESLVGYPDFLLLTTETFDSIPVDTQQQQQRGYFGSAMQYPQTPSSTLATINPSLVSPVHEMFPEAPPRHQQLEVQIEPEEGLPLQYNSEVLYPTVHRRQVSISSSESASDSEDDSPTMPAPKCQLPLSSTRHTVTSRSMVAHHNSPSFSQEEDAEGESELDADPPAVTTRRRHFPKRKFDDIRASGGPAVKRIASRQEECQATNSTTEPASVAEVVKSRKRPTRSIKTYQSVLPDSPPCSPVEASVTSSRRISPGVDGSVDSFSPPASDDDTDVDDHIDSDDYAPVLSHGVKKRTATPKKRRVGGRDPQKRQSQNQKAQCKYRQKRKQMAELDRRTTIKLLRLFGTLKGKGVEAKRQYFDALRDLDPTHHAEVLAEVEG